MPEEILHQNTLLDDWNRELQITHTTVGYYRKILTLGWPEEQHPHGRPITQWQYNKMRNKAGLPEIHS